MTGAGADAYKNLLSTEEGLIQSAAELAALKHAAAEGDVSAMFGLSAHYDATNDYEESHRWLEMAGEAHDCHAIRLLIETYGKEPFLNKRLLNRWSTRAREYNCK